jgi:hypothetical protein
MNALYFSSVSINRFKNKVLLFSDGTAFKRKPSSRKVNSNHRKSGAFLDVPPGENKKLAEPEDPENSYRLRSFSFTSKGEILLIN